MGIEEILSDLDTTDYTFLEKYQAVNDKITEELNNLPDFKNTVEETKYVCNMLISTSNQLLGEDKTKLLFTKPTSMNNILKVWKDVVGFIHATIVSDKEEFTKTLDEISAFNKTKAKVKKGKC